MEVSTYGLTSLPSSWVWKYFPGHDTDVQIVFNKIEIAERPREHKMGRGYGFN